MYRVFISLVLGFVVTNVFAKFDNKQTVVDKTTEVANHQITDYVNYWWQWTKSMPMKESPVIDRTGEKCHVNQQGDVWFLAGGYGSSKIRRTCAIPEGKFLFFPIINMIYYPKPGKTLTCEDAMKFAAMNNDKLFTISVELDGKEITGAGDFRIKSEKCFDLYGRVPAEYNAGKVFPSATDGYWLMLKPLSKGKHKLKFFAQYNREGGANGNMAQDIEYEIHIQ